MEGDLNGPPDVLSAMAVQLRLCLPALAALLVVSMSGAATAANPWQLHCASMPAEQRMPAAVRAVALTFYPWVRPAEKGLQAGPFYVVALSSRTAISRDGDEQYGSRYYLHRALIAEMIAEVVDAAHILARIQLDAGRLGPAKAATVAGLAADPCNEMLFRDAIEAAHRSGDTDEVNRLTVILRARIDEIDPGCDLEDETVDLLNLIRA